MMTGPTLLRNALLAGYRNCILDLTPHCRALRAGREVFHLHKADGYSFRDARRYLTSSTELTIQEHTEITHDHLTPEIKLHLITQNCTLWRARPECCPFTDPFWAFYWPGGQALTRFILDNPDQFAHQRVLDVGSGCGASAIACVMSGAERVIANDIDPVALCAIQMNARLNNITIETDSRNKIGQQTNTLDYVLLGDMFYDYDFSKTVFSWVQQLVQARTRVLIGDPGRAFFSTSLPMKHMRQVAKYALSKTCRQENNGLTHAYVWEFTKLRSTT